MVLADQSVTNSFCFLNRSGKMKSRILSRDLFSLLFESNFRTARFYCIFASSNLMYSSRERSVNRTNRRTSPAITKRFIGQQRLFSTSDQGAGASGIGDVIHTGLGTPIDDMYRPKLIKCQTGDGSIKTLPPEALREASVHASAVPTCNIRASTRIVRELESKVMVLYTGGTIGMKLKDGAYAPESNYLPKALRQLPHLNDQAYVDAHFAHAPIPPCVLPPVKGEDRRILYWVFEYEPLWDSCDMTFDDWIRIAKDIYKAYEEYDGFVILHGTDTLSYTASALSFVFEHLGKTIVLTGSQIPVAEVRSDGRENFVGALIIAANYDIPEVTVYFDNKLFRGNRTSKVDNSCLDAFDSPNMPPLAHTEISINVHWDDVFRNAELKRVHVHTQLNRHVGLLRLFPSITVQCVRMFLQPPMEGVVLQTFGAGNVPSSRTDILDELKKAVERGVIIVNCSQCSRGQVSPTYQTGKILLDIGVLPGSDMTPEAALTKLAYVLGKEDLDLQQKKQWMCTSLRGELTVSRDRKISLRDNDIIYRLAKFLHISTAGEMVAFRDALYPPLLCEAASKDDVPMLRRFRDSGAIMAAADSSHRTALHVAATTGNLESVKFLLAEGVSVHMTDNNDETPLLGAVRQGHHDVIKVLMDAGAHLTVPSYVLAVELCLLVCRRDLHTLEAWKLARADFNVVDYDKRTPLHVAASWGFEEVARYLLNNGASPRAVDIFGNMPIDDAIRNGHWTLVELLKGWTAIAKTSTNPCPTL